MARVVADYCGREAAQDLNDDRTRWTSPQLAGVEIDDDNNSARLIPAEDRRTFEQFLARLASY